MNNFSLVIQADESSALELQLGRFIPTAAPQIAALTGPQNANLVLSGPASGAAVPPSYRQLVTADLAGVTLPVANGGTGHASAGAAAANAIGALAMASNLSDVSNAATARSNISAAKSGANSDITSLSGLTAALSISQGGTGQATQAAALSALLGASLIPVINGGTNASTAAGARTSLGAAASGANSDITSLSGLTTALSVGQGGTGGATAAAARSALGAAATGTDLSQFAATTSAQLAGVISDETGTGKLVFGTAPTLNQPNIVGNTTGAAAAVGSVGELLTANASGTSVPNASSFNAVSLTLTPGVWDVSGAIQYLPVSVTSFNSIIAGISTVSGTLGAVGSNYVIQGALSSPGANHAPTPTLRVSVAANTPVYLVGTLAFTGGSCTANSTIRAARVI
ncbi:hypothetical protein [Paraburkholderia sp. SIMBA_054]|uniref:hypothetical protein n=2 Tax=Bacteria TaxID=2 RepID=UPI00397C5B04